MRSSDVSGRLLALLLSAFAASGCGPPRAAGSPPPASAAAAAFVDVAPAMGIRFRSNEAIGRPRDILDANGSGCAMLDYDLDGDLDFFLAGRPACALYRNDGERFTDVTSASRLGRKGRFHGVGVADWDSDGDPDLCVTGYHDGALYRNDGGVFQDVTRESGVTFPDWGQSAAFGDVDNDGAPDLYIAAYARFGAHSPRFCTRQSVQALCGPEIYPPESGRFFRNLRGGRFQDETRRSGLIAHGRTWGVMFQDIDDDGRQDLYAGNDMLAGDLFQNLGGRRFRNIGVESGTAYEGEGRLQGAMGVDWADYDNDGRPDLVVTTFSAQPTSLYRNEGSRVFSEVSYAAGVAEPTFPYVGWGARFLDFDNDGHRDLLVANGHVEDNAEQSRGEPYRQPILLLRNRYGEGTPGAVGRFTDVSSTELAGVPHIVARGAAFGDYDSDGRTDALVMDLEGTPLLLHNRSLGGHWLGIRLRGKRSGRDALGARVTVATAAGSQRFECQTSGSVLSANDPRILAGLGRATQVREVTIRWPSGAISRRRNLAVDRYVTIEE